MFQSEPTAGFLEFPIYSILKNNKNIFISIVYSFSSDPEGVQKNHQREVSASDFWVRDVRLR
jgi:hypothetical protein